MTRILVPLEHSPGNARVLQLAAAMARALEGTITLLHVYSPPNAMVGIVRGASVASELGAEQSSGHDLLAGARAVLAGVGFSDVDVLLEQNPSVHHAIIGEAARFDFIVMGTHGRRGFDRAVLGSVAERVVRAAPCPVVTIHL
jgi:nucleotide-binding universal stress UspA family protein